MNAAGYFSSKCYYVEKNISVTFVFLLFLDGVWRGNKLLNLKHIADGAVDICKERLMQSNAFCSIL